MAKGATDQQIQTYTDSLINEPATDQTSIDNKIAKLTRQFNEWNGFQYKSGVINAGLEALKNEIGRLNTKKVELETKGKSGEMAMGYDPIMQGINDKIKELQNLPQTDLEKQVLSTIQSRMSGEGMQLTPNDVTQWYGLVQQMQDPSDKIAQEQMKQQYGDIGRYYGGGASQQQRKLIEEQGQQRYGNALNIAQQQQGIQQAGIQGALGQGLNLAQYQKSLQQQPINTWLGMIPQLQTAQLGAKYGAPVTQYQFNPSVIPNYQYQPNIWEQTLASLIPAAVQGVGTGLGGAMGQPVTKKVGG